MNPLKLIPSYYLGEAIGDTINLPNKQQEVTNQDNQDYKTIGSLKSNAEKAVRNGFTYIPQKDYQQIQTIYQNMAGRQKQLAQDQQGIGNKAVSGALGSLAAFLIPQINKLDWTPTSESYIGGNNVPTWLYQALAPRIK